MRRILLSSVACVAVLNFATLSQKRYDFRVGECTGHAQCVFRFSVMFLSSTFLILRRIQLDIIMHIHRTSRKVLCILSCIYTERHVKRCVYYHAYTQNVTWSAVYIIMHIHRTSREVLCILSCIYTELHVKRCVYYHAYTQHFTWSAVYIIMYIHRTSREVLCILSCIYTELHVKFCVYYHVYTQNFTWSALYSCQILMKLGFFETRSNIKFHENPSGGSRAVPRGRTDRHAEANSRFPHFCERV